ncbi:MAG: MMPL family transporter [Roseiarcus sp.]|jgi:hopanoid biosynthesis associated RND transporter like protein HpnN|uniref:hopanoid transporter HpnN n=1 Tax=Roseiarcus sp. TaxID=1969460 RepID=UPI003C1CB965
MLTSIIVRIVEFCIRRAWMVVGVGLLIATGSSVYTASHFRLNSDVSALLSDKLDWSKRDIAFESAFDRFGIIDVIVAAPTPELTGAATVELTRALAKEKALLPDVSNAGATEFFARHGLLFLPKEALEKNLGGLIQGEALIQDLSSDRSLRGLIAGLEDVLLGLQSNHLKLDDLGHPLNQVSDTLDNVLAGRPASFSWRVLMQGKPAAPNDLRGFIEVHSALDFSALQPGLRASEAIRRIAADILPKYQASMRLTGVVTMNDEQFGTIKENAVRNGLVTLAIVACILWLALRSGRLMAAIAINLFVGLAATAALGLFMVGAYNLISVYFSVLFVGIGVDFGIQFSVRYRSERHDIDNLAEAIQNASFRVGAPLTLAAFATAAGFLSFLPTDYKGVSELGQIAGCGMLIAFATTITLLPALIVLLNPPGEPEPLGYSSLAPVDAYMNRHRIGIIAGTAIVVVAGLPLLHWLSFDFNPINLQSPKTESIATYLELSRDPSTDTNAIQVLAPSLEQGNAIGARVSKLPEVSHVVTLSSFIPEDQAEKLPVIQNAANKLAAAFDPKNVQPAPTDVENIDALNEGSQRLTEAASNLTGSGADAARRLAFDLSNLALATQAARDKATDSFVWSLGQVLDSLQASLQTPPVTRLSLPPDLTQDWVTSDGRARVSIAPKDDPDDNDAMRRFARAVLAVEPSATEGPITILEAGDLVVHAFVEAGALALLSIAILLWLVLRRLGDVLLTLIPLALAGVVTLELTVLVGLPLNFANIIALPLLLGVGVAFKIYYIMAWREGQTNLLQTSLTRAVIYSALTTATAFGSLIFSSHPGTSSMGKLLALSLVCTLAAAVLFQPILMGKPRKAPSEI